MLCIHSMLVKYALYFKYKAEKLSENEYGNKQMT